MVCDGSLLGHSTWEDPELKWGGQGRLKGRGCSFCTHCWTSSEPLFSLLYLSLLAHVHFLEQNWPELFPALTGRGCAVRRPLRWSVHSPSAPGLTTPQFFSSPVPFSCMAPPFLTRAPGAEPPKPITSTPHPQVHAPCLPRCAAFALCDSRPLLF